MVIYLLISIYDGQVLIKVIELCSKIEDVNATMVKKLYIAPEGQQHLAASVKPCHNLYRVPLKNGEKWAIDTTGAQFGYAERLAGL